MRQLRLTYNLSFLSTICQYISLDLIVAKLLTVN